MDKQVNYEDFEVLYTDDKEPEVISDNESIGCLNIIRMFFIRYCNI